MPARQHSLNEARCARLLRRLTSAIHTLRSRLQSAPSFAAGATEARRNSRTTRHVDEEWHGSKSSASKGSLTRKDSFDGDFVLGATLSKRRRTKKTYSGSGKASATAKVTAQDLSEELPEGFSQSKDVSVDSVMASAVKTVLHLETYSIFCTIVRALRDILEQTVETRDKERMHVGIPSLSNMVAGQVGAAILEEKEEDAMDEIYQYVGDLSAGDYMRNLLRGHAIEILRAEVEEGLFSECGGEHGAIVGTRLVAVFIKLLLEFSAFNEASLLFDACASHNTYTWQSYNTTISLLTTSFRPRYEEDGLLPTYHNCVSSGLCRTHPALKVQASLFTDLLNSEKRGEFLATPSMSAYIEKLMDCLNIFSGGNVMAVQYARIINTFLLASFGISENDLMLSSTIKRAKRHRYTEDYSEPMKRGSADKAERLLMSTAMRLCTVTSFGNAKGIWKTNEDGFLPAYMHMDGPSFLVNIVNAFIRQPVAITRTARRFWGGAAAYPTEAKLVMLVRALYCMKDVTEANQPIRSKVLHKTLRIINHLEKDELITVSIHIADHFANMARNTPPEISMWDIKEFVSVLLDLASGISSEEIVGEDQAKTPLKAHTSVQKNLVEISMRLAMQFVTHPEWAAKESWVAWSSEVEVRGMGFGIASPVEKREKIPKQGLSWTRKEEVVGESRPGYRWEEGLQEFVAVGYTPVKRPRTSASYKAPNLKTLTGGLVSSDDELAAESENENDGDYGSKPLTRLRSKRMSNSSAQDTSEASAEESDGWDTEENEEQESPISSASSVRSKKSPSTAMTPAPRSVLQRRIRLEIHAPSLSTPQKREFMKAMDTPGHLERSARSTRSRRRIVESEDEDDAEDEMDDNEEDEEEEDDEDASEAESESEQEEADDIAMPDADDTPAPRYSLRSPRVTRSVQSTNMPPPSSTTRSTRSTRAVTRLGIMPTPLKSVKSAPKTPLHYSLTAEARLFNSRNTPQTPLFSSSNRNSQYAEVGETPAPKPRTRQQQATESSVEDSDDTLASIHIEDLSPRKQHRSPPRRHSTGSKRLSQTKPKPVPVPASASLVRSLRHKPRINYNENTLLPSFTPRKASPSPPPELNISVKSLRTRQSVNYTERLDFSDDELNASPMVKRKVVYKEIEAAGHMLRKRRREIELVSESEEEDDTSAKKKERILARKARGLRCSGRLWSNAVKNEEMSEDELSMMVD